MEGIDITITGGVLGITERRSIHPRTLDRETRRALRATFGSASTPPVPTTDDQIRDGRVVTIRMGDASTCFHEHLSPHFWTALKAKTRPGGG